MPRDHASAVHSSAPAHAERPIPASTSHPPFRFDEARAAILFAWFRAGVTAAEAELVGEAPEIPAAIGPDEARATWRAVGHFRDAWIDYGERVADVCRVIDACGAGSLAYAFHAGCLFGKDAEDRSQHAPPRLPSRRELGEVQANLVKHGIAESWLTLSSHARQTFARLTAPIGAGTFTPGARPISGAGK